MIKCRLCRVPAGYSGRGGSTSSKQAVASPGAQRPRAIAANRPLWPVKKGDITGDWFSYAVAAAAAMAIALYGCSARGMVYKRTRALKRATND
jgi:hypothetical protein